MTAATYMRALSAVIWRELLRFVHQRQRLLAALVRPLVWLIIFAAGFRTILGVSIVPPYQTYVTYDVYIMPGLLGMILLFNAMQTSLSMVYDREMGSMRVLLTAPFPRWFLLLSKLVSGVVAGLVQVYLFFIIARLLGVHLPNTGFLTIAPALVLSGLMLGAMALLITSLIRQLENFAGVMNFIIFPMLFLSSALYPIWRIEEQNRILALACYLNPFTHVVELIRFSVYAQVNLLSLAITGVGGLIVFALAAWLHAPARRFPGQRRAA